MENDKSKPSGSSGSEDGTIEACWLIAQVKTLLRAASSGTDPDHAACAKYVDALVKLLPHGRKPATSREVEQIRKEIESGQS